jgi:ribosomal protein L16 Arg81 hydroxylase
METVLATPKTSAGSPVGFSLFLGDFDPDLFFSQYWERRSLHIRNGDPLRFSHLISAESLFEHEVKRCHHLKASTRDRDGWNLETRIQPDQAANMYRAGMTICASMLEERGPIGEVIKAYRSAITTAAPPHVNCYYSPDTRGYGLHFDTHPVWILQVSGSKHWTVSHEPGVKEPPFNVVFPPGRDRVKLPWITLDRPDVTDRDRFMEVQLNPGDVLYMPAGAWHAARAEGSSLALTVALGRVGTADLFNAIVGQTIQQRLRETTTRLPPMPTSDAAGGASRRADLMVRIAADLARLKALVQRIEAEDLLRIYEAYAEHPEALLAGRQLVGVKEQVQSMKAAYPGKEEGR